MYRVKIVEKFKKTPDAEYGYAYKVCSGPIILNPDLVFKGLVDVPPPANKVKIEKSYREMRQLTKGIERIDEITMTSDEPFWVVVQRYRWEAPHKEPVTEYLIYEATDYL